MMLAQKQQDTVPTSQANTRQSQLLRSRVAAPCRAAAAPVGLAAKWFPGAASATMFSFPFQFDESEGMIVAETQFLIAV